MNADLAPGHNHPRQEPVGPLYKLPFNEFLAEFWAEFHDNPPAIPKPSSLARNAGYGNNGEREGANGTTPPSAGASRDDERIC